MHQMLLPDVLLCVQASRCCQQTILLNDLTYEYDNTYTITMKDSQAAGSGSNVIRCRPRRF